MVSCKYCRSKRIVKDGYVQGKQRYLCRDCKRTGRNGDAREKYSIEKKIKVIKLYTEGVGLRSIERLEDVSASLLVYWLRNFGKMIREKLSATKIPDDAKEISILELDELFTYCKKKPRKPMFGLLWTETGIRLLIL